MEEFGYAHKRLLRTQSLIERTTPFNFLIPRRQFRRDKCTINEFFQPTIDKIISLPEAELAKLDTTDYDWSFAKACAAVSRDPKFMLDELVAIVIAGRDTTSQTMAFALYELARNPEVVTELRSEIQETVGIGTDARAPTYADLKKMSHLSHILNETLRLYPNVPVNIREAMKDTSLPRGGGPDGSKPVGLQAGTSVVYSTQILRKPFPSL